MVLKLPKINRSLRGGEFDEMQDVYADAKLIKFYVHWYDCYTTSFPPFAEISSLQVYSAGSSPYIMQTEDGKITTTGKIIVKCSPLSKIDGSVGHSLISISHVWVLWKNGV
jgi:hypothetical protein